MKAPYSQLEMQARRAFPGNYSLAIGAELAIYGITMGVIMGLEMLLMVGAAVVALASENTMTTYTVVMFVPIYRTTFGVEMMLTSGMLRMYMNLCTGQKARVGDTFLAFKNRGGKFVLITLAVGVITIVIMTPMIVLPIAVGMAGDAGGFLVASSAIYWILLGVATMYVQLTFGTFYFVIIEDLDKGILQALLESRQIMRGNRCRYFGLGLSFLGILALAYMSFGIGMLWIVPYLICTNVFFYLNLKPVVEVYQPQWEMAGMQGETFVGTEFTEVPGQTPVEPEYAEVPGQAPAEPKQSQSSAQPDDMYESYGSQNWQNYLKMRIEYSKEVYSIRICELKQKEVINANDYKRLGFVGDVGFDMCIGCMVATIVPGPGCFYGFIGREKEYIIPSCDICQVGDGIILVGAKKENVEEACKV